MIWQFDSDTQATIVNQTDSNATQVVSQPRADATQMAATVECPVCRTPNASTETYCSDCGFLLGSTPVEAETAEVQEPAAKLTTPDGREFVLNAGLNTVGRVDTDVLIAAPTVSRKHAEIDFRDGAWWLTDVGSTNGTFIDDVQLEPNEPVQLMNGANIKFGATVVSFSATEVAPTEETTIEETAAVEAEPVGEEGVEGQEPAASEEVQEVEAALPDTAEEFQVQPAEAGAEAVEAATIETETPALAGKLVDIADQSVSYPIFSGVNTIGRASDNSIQIAGDPYVSGHHAEITSEDGRFTLTDVGSTNGTLLNSKVLPKQEPRELSPGDEIAIGQRRYRFEA